MSKTMNNRELTKEEIEMLDALENRPVVVDEECPELTPATEAAVLEARRRKPLKVSARQMYSRVPVNDKEMIPVTVERAAALDQDEKGLMSRLLTDALRALDTRRN